MPKADCQPTPPLAPPADFPEVYGVIAHGDCLAPYFNDGDAIVATTRTAPVDGDFVIVHLKPEAQGPWGYEAVIKRLRYGLYGMTFPWDPTGSDVVIPIAVEQLNPPRSYNIPVTHIRAVHKVLGRAHRGPNGTLEAPREMVEAG